MVKKNYVAPATNESRTKLRATILAGSGGFGGQGGSSLPSGEGPGKDDDKGTQDDFARQRSVSSLD